MAPSPRDAAALAEWDFLFSWLDVITTKGVICNADGLDDADDVRVGRDARDDSWIELSLGREELDLDWALGGNDDDDDDSSDDGFFGSEQRWLKKPAVREVLREVREAMVLTSAMAQIDYDGWLAMLRDNATMDIPPHWLVPDASGQLPRIPVRFKLMLKTQNDMDFLDWNSTLSHLLGTREYSALYQECLKWIRLAAARRGIAWESIEPAPLIIRLTFNGELYVTSDLRGRLLRLTEAVQSVKRIAQDVERDGTWRGSLLTIGALEIDFLRTEIHDDILNALLTLLQAGVRVTYLRLPQLQSQLPSVATWATFVRLALGVDHDDHGRLASVRRLIIPAAYAVIFHFAPFCSALAFARGVDVVHFAGSKHPDGTDAFGIDGTHDRDHVWRWLSFALLSRASQSSVTRLILDGERPLLRDSDTIQAMMDSASPLVDLYKKAYGSEESPVPTGEETAVEPVVIPKWTVVRLCDGKRGTTDTHTTRDLVGERLGTDPATGDSLILVPGYGFCMTKDAEPSHKRAKSLPVPLQAGSSFESIVFTPGQSTPMDATALLKILSTLGRRLRSLRFTVESTDTTLRAVFASCPHLDSLAVTGLRLPESMDVFTDAYTTGATHITSLSLGHVATSEEAARAFLNRLTDRQYAIAQTLERIYWNVQPPHQQGRVIEAVSEFETVLDRNQTLTHVCGVAPPLVRFHGRSIPGRSHEQKQQLMAFLGAMRTYAIARTVDNVVWRRVWAFAEDRRHRSVVASEW